MSWTDVTDQPLDIQCTNCSQDQKACMTNIYWGKKNKPALKTTGKQIRS